MSASYSPYKQCAECGKTMSASDMHRKCQKCRNGGVYPKWHGYKESYYKQAVANLNAAHDQGDMFGGMHA